MKFVKVVDHPNLVRDAASKAILSTNKDEILKYRKIQQKKQLENNEINNLKRRIEQLENIVNALLEEKNVQSK